MTEIPSFQTILEGIHGTDYDLPDKLLAFDPGETIGWAYFEFATPTKITQSTKFDDFRLASIGLETIIREHKPDVVVIEDYRIYEQKAKAHSWGKLFTVKVIAAIETLCAQREIPVVLQMASAKQFCSDEKLKAWGFYQSGKPHANDAVRHGCYYLLFHNRSGGA